MTDFEPFQAGREAGGEVLAEIAKYIAGHELFAPGDTVIVADYKGYVHWLNRATGAIIGRERAGRARVSSTPVAADGLLLVIDDQGRITAFRATPIAGA